MANRALSPLARHLMRGASQDGTRTLLQAGGGVLSVLLGRWLLRFPRARVAAHRRSRRRRGARRRLRSRRRRSPSDLLRPRSRTDRGSDAPLGAVARGLEQVVFGLRRPRANGSGDWTISGRKSEIRVSLPHEESRLSAG